ncbi:catalase/peroxidase HPI [Beggiatoa leptomitoformis]|uniref:Catalase-peroxidase n=1 Tax=Beggiatoa leptomitoformis TaxID=288004 RepID=A0A2N9YFJ9_9GAMM|nr:catalase/peroxidase HPI [Beggiatoa leptomitoformis]ALG68409.1 catalase/peroxidase HPI [Beggiatoa leptomitoformis]AUI69264.1 catalase/peroxidase HPI [Beggiatoa leptomitoformis]
MFKKTLVFTACAIALNIFTPTTSFAAATMAHDNQFWWPQKLDLAPLRAHDARSNPYGHDFNYAEAFSHVDLKALKADIEKVLKTSQDWWPADWGHYGGLMIRMAWHSAGTYRIHDGRGGADGGQQRFEPLNSWPDNVSLDKARRLLWPVKQKYGRSVSWADLIILAGNVSLESMGFKTLGFAGGRVDDWEADHVYWGAETKMLDNKERYKDGQLEKPLAAVQMGLIYVNPEGPNGSGDPLAAAKDMRESFGRMAMNDEEIVALVAGGHTLGKAHGAKPVDCLGAEPTAAAVEEQGLGWKNKCGKGNAEDTLTSGLEGAWSTTPTAWSILFLDNLFRFDWEKVKSPAGATQWKPIDKAAQALVPDAHIKDKRLPPMMFTTDIALKEDPEFRKIAEHFWKNPKEFDKAFAKAWFKLTHRDLGPRTRYLGNEIPQEVFIWQDPVPAVDYQLIEATDIANLKTAILKTGLTIPELVRTAWASASTFRGSDMRGGANGARVRLAPQKDWTANNPTELTKVLTTLEKVQTDFNSTLTNGKTVSLADIIVLGGAVAIEEAAKQAGYTVNVPFTQGRTDATAEMTDVHSFAVLEPTADAFRNYYSDKSYASPTEMLVEKADFLTLTIPEMTVLIGGMRALNANVGQSQYGVLTTKPGTLNNDFFVNLLDMSTKWQKSAEISGGYEGLDRASGKQKWTATSVDLIFGSNSELRAVAEAYAADDSKEKFVNDFVAAWTKVMNLDHF